MYNFNNIDTDYIDKAHTERANNGTNTFLNELLLALPDSYKPNTASEIVIEGRTFNVTISAELSKLECRQFVTSNSGLITYHKPTKQVYVVSTDNLQLNGSKSKTNARGQIIRNAKCLPYQGSTQLNIDLYNDKETDKVNWRELYEAEKVKNIKLLALLEVCNG